MDETTKLKIELLRTRIMLNEANGMVLQYQNRDMLAEIAKLEAEGKPVEAVGVE